MSYFFLIGRCLIPFARANQLNPWKITIVLKARSWVITDARNAAKCSTRGMCNKKAIASVKSAVSKRKQPKKKMNTGKQKNTGKQGRKK